MFCSNCGAKNNDGAKFCNGCGSMLISNASAPQAAPAPQVTPVSQTAPVAPVINAPAAQPKREEKVKKELPEFIKKPLNFIKQSKPAKIGLIAGGAGLIVIIVLVLVVIVPLINKAEADAALQRYIDAKIGLDFETVVDFTPPDRYESLYESSFEKYGTTRKEFRERRISLAESERWRTSCDPHFLKGDWSSYHTNYTIDYSRAASPAELAELNDFLIEHRDYKTKASYAVFYKLTLGYESKCRTETDGIDYDVYIMCLKYDDNWYIIEGYGTLDHWQLYPGLTNADKNVRVSWVFDLVRANSEDY